MFFTKHKIVSEQQFGFQRNKSTEMALLNIEDKFITNIEIIQYRIGLFLDFRKAFDSVKHKILLTKLSTYGVRGKAQELICSYLSSRSQFTVYNGIKSDIQQIAYGVPQGSILGPLLFLVYINDIVHISHSADMVLFADDSNVFFSHNDLRHLESVSNDWLNKLSTWLVTNQIELNISKTKYIIFRAKNKALNYDIDIQFNSNKLEKVELRKFLVVWVHENLHWTTHVSKLCLTLTSHRHIT